MHRLLVVAALVLVACGSSKKDDGGGGGGGTKEVSGTVVVDGKPRTITGCLVKERMDTRITLLFDGGNVNLEDGDLSLYLGDDEDGMMQGRKLTCGKLGGERFWGTTSFSKPGWARGQLVADCTAPVPVKVDVTLTCGTLSPEQEQRMKEMREEMQKEAADFAGRLSGTDGDAGVGGGDDAAMPATDDDAGAGTAAPAP